MPSSRFKLPRALPFFAVLALIPASLEAQPSEPELVPGIYCNVGGPTSPTWVACSGAWSGNDAGEVRLEHVWNLIQARDSWDYEEAGFDDAFGVVQSWNDPADPDFDFEDFYIGTTDLGKDEGPFYPFNNATSGKLDIRNPYLGVFVLILKGGDYFNMYLLDLRAMPAVTEIYYNMGNLQGLSHASWWGGPGTTVPEPSSMLLLASGLLGLGVVGYRRRRK